MATGRFVSKTRRIESLPLHLLKRGKIHLMPVYYLARLSRLGSELISNQGSAEYQDLVYLNQPQGKLLIGCYGAMEPRVLQAGETYSVDTGHIVGFDASIQFSVRKVGSWKSTLLGGEGLVCELTGPGRLLMQTRSEEALIGYLAPRMPQDTN